MTNIILIGPPGVGKGTQANHIINSYGFNYITTGNLLRAEAKLDTNLGHEISKVISRGELVSDSIVERLIKSELDKCVSNGILFDGYPRNLNQVYALENILSDFNRKIDLVINMFLEDDLLIKRISGRYVCTHCGMVYNKFFVNPDIAGVCNQCQGNDFLTRSDDSEEIIKKRLIIFHEENNAMVKYYRNIGVLVDIHCDSSVNEISQECSKEIDRLNLKQKVNI